MNNLEFEKKLAENGFTGKEIAKLRAITSKNSESYLYLLNELRSRFIKAVVLLLIISVFYIMELSSKNSVNMLVFTISIAFAFLLLYVFIPLKLGFKAYFFMRKERH